MRLKCLTNYESRMRYETKYCRPLIDPSRTLSLLLTLIPYTTRAGNRQRGRVQCVDTTTAGRGEFSV